MGTSSGSGPRATPEDLLAQSLWLRRLARSLVADPSSADDLVQETWVAALESPPHGDRPLKPWLARVVRNLVRSRHRSDTARRGREIARFVPAQGAGPTDALESIDLQRVLLDAVEALSEPQRSTIVRHYFHGLTSAEIARQDGVADATVRWRLGQAIETLRQRLDARHGGDRSAWAVMLMPLARRAHGPASTAAATSAAATLTAVWIITMGTGTKLVVAAALAVAVALGTWTVVQRNALQPTPAVALHDKAVNGLDGLAVATTRAPDDARAAIAPSPSSADMTRATAATPAAAIVEARIVDAQGLPIAGAVMRCILREGSLTKRSVGARNLIVRSGTSSNGPDSVPDPSSTASIDASQDPESVSGADGRVRVELHRADAARGQGSSMFAAEDRWYVYLEFTAPGHSRQQVYEDVHDGRTRDLGDIALVVASDVIGKVVDEQGNGLANVDVFLVLPDVTLAERDHAPWTGLPRKSARGFASTEPDGTFRIQAVPDGFYRAWTQRPGRLCVLTDDFQVAAGEHTDLRTLVMAPNDRVLSGTVIGLDGQPCAAEIRFAPAGSHEHDEREQVSTGLDGKFLLDGIDARSMDVYVESQSDEPKEAGFAAFASVATPRSEWIVQLQPSPFLDLVVLDTDAHPIDSIVVNLQDEVFGTGFTRFTSGAQHVRVPGNPFLLDVGASGYLDHEKLRIDPRKDRLALTVTLQRMASVHGTVLSSKGPVPGAEILLLPLVENGEAWTENGFPARVQLHRIGMESTKADGTFSIASTQDAHSILIVHAKDFAMLETEPFDVGPQQGRDGLILHLTAGGSVRGRVIGFDPGHNDVRYVTASRGTGFDTSRLIEADGTYTMQNLSAGTWMLRATERDYTDMFQDGRGAPDPANVTVTVVEGETTQLDLKAVAKTPIVLEGRLVPYPGDETWAWTASIRETDNDDIDWISESLDLDGTFRLKARKAGRHHLRLRSSSDSTYSTDVDLSAGTNTWSYQPVSGALGFHHTPRSELTLDADLPEGVHWSRTVRPSGPPADSYYYGSVPAGILRIRSANGALKTVEVKAKEVTYAD